METGKLAAAIEMAVNREKARSLAHQENDARLMEAVAMFATPGAMAAAFRRGLSADQRAFCAGWFCANRDLAMRLGYRVGTEAMFAELEKDPGPFRARYGPAPKFSPGRHEFGRERRKMSALRALSPESSLRKPTCVGRSQPCIRICVAAEEPDAFLDLGA